MAIEVVLTCPLGSTCEEVKDNKIHRCRWYKCLAGQDPQTGEILNDVWDCSLSWLPVLLVENANTNRGQTAAVESFRNEMVKGSEITNTILAMAANNTAMRLSKD